MKDVLYKEIPTASMHTMNLVNKIGLLFKLITIEIIQIQFMTPEEFQLNKELGKEETLTLKNKNFWINLCQYGQHSTLLLL